MDLEVSNTFKLMINDFSSCVCVIKDRDLGWGESKPGGCKTHTGSCDFSESLLYSVYLFLVVHRTVLAGLPHSPRPKPSIQRMHDILRRSLPAP